MQDEQDRIWENIKKKENLKEYMFMTSAGYRTFFVLGKDLKDAEDKFMSYDLMKRNGFELDDLPIRLEYTSEMENYRKEDFWEKNENEPYVTKQRLKTEEFLKNY